MKTYTAEELKEILELHKKFLNDEPCGILADLSHANLMNADLMHANLGDADLMHANLMGANLKYANLLNADLRYANFSWSVGNMREIKSMQIETCQIAYTIDQLAIGCEQYSIEEWKIFGNEEINNMDSEATEFWTKWKNMIFKIIKMSPAVDWRKK